MAGAEADHGVSAWPDRNRVIALFIAYFLLHLLVRLLISGGVELDEGEQLILGQELRWGYGPQPPLYTWLQASLFTLFGTNVFSLALCKNLLLFSMYIFTYLSAREITGEDISALAAMSSLFFMPQIAWESHRDLTHTVLVNSSVALTLYLFIRLSKTRKASSYVLFGICAGVGILAKYSYGIFLAGAVLAALSMKDFREVLADRRILLSLLGFFAFTSPHFLWMSTHVDATLSQTAKFNIGQANGNLAAYSLGLANLAKTAATILLPSMILYGLVLRRAPACMATTSEEEDYRKLIGRILFAGLIISAAMILIFQVTYVKERWVQPLLIPAPVYIVLAVRRRLSPAMARRIIALAAVVMAAVLVALPSRTLLASYLGRSSSLNAPYAALAKQLEELGFDGGLIVAEDRLVGGSMKLVFKQSVVIVPELPAFAAPDSVPRLIVWDAKDRGLIRRDLVDFANSRFAMHLSPLESRFIEAPRHYSVNRRMQLGFILVGGPRTP